MMEETEDRVETTPPHRSDPGVIPQSLRSDRSVGRLINFKEDPGSQSAPGTVPESLRSDRSHGRPINFKEGPGSQSAPETNPVSLRSDRSIGPPMNFKGEHDSQILQTLSASDPVSGCGSLRSDWSVGHREESSSESVEQLPELTRAQQHHTQLDSIFKLLEQDIFTFAQEELKKVYKALNTDDPESLEPEVDEDDEQKSSSEAFLKITLNFLKRRRQNELAERLSMRSCSGVLRRKLKSELQQKCVSVFEGVAKAGNPTPLQQIYTKLHITEGGAAELNQEHEVRQMETASRNPSQADTAITCEDIFRIPEDSKTRIRTVMTKGVAGIGKTVLTQKFSLDWAEGKANRDIQLLFPFTFRELNVLMGRNFGLFQLVRYFFRVAEELYSFENLRVLFIFDGLDECRLPLDFIKTKAMNDPRESASVEELLVNLIRGNLLPSAQLWITTRPAAANQIPAECISMVTEVRGFNDKQKEQYFRKRFINEQQATAVISHIQTNRSLYIMCYMPIFCWILSVVLQMILEQTEKLELPHTLTQMFIHFLVVQVKIKNIKYHNQSGADLHWSPETKEMVNSLGKLAFEQLMKGNLIFYISDVSECGLDAAKIAHYSGVFTQVFIEQSGLYQDKVYCFIHLTVQEFLAALHVHQTFVNTGINLLSAKPQKSPLHKLKPNLKRLHRSAVYLASQSPNGHLDLFLRFLLGLSLPENQRLLHGLLKETGSSSHQETAKYIKEKLSKEDSPEKSINLFHCLNELNDRSLVEQIQQYLSSGRLSEGRLSPAQWSALAFILLSSKEHLHKFELKKYCASDEALVRLLPVVKVSNKALLSCCNLTESICEALSSVLSSSNLTVLDLSNNDLKDSGLKMISVGLKSPHCKLQKLSLSGCLISEDGCAALTSALRSNPSHMTHLDLSYNHPGATAVNQLSALQEELHCSLKSLRLEPAGAEWLTPGLHKYSSELSLDPNTAHRRLKLSNNNRRVTCVREKQPYPDHPDRFDHHLQLLCGAALTGRSYWEVQWSGVVSVSVSYGGTRRKGRGDDRVYFGYNDQSWSLYCSQDDFYVWHKNKRTILPRRWSSSSGTVAVYVDGEAGSLSFYAVSSGRLIHLHTFKTEFTDSLIPGFVLWYYGSSVSLLDSRGSS